MLLPVQPAKFTRRTQLSRHRRAAPEKRRNPFGLSQHHPLLPLPPAASSLHAPTRQPTHDKPQIPAALATAPATTPRAVIAHEQNAHARSAESHPRSSRPPRRETSRPAPAPLAARPKINSAPGAHPPGARGPISEPIAVADLSIGLARGLWTARDHGDNPTLIGPLPHRPAAHSRADLPPAPALLRQLPSSPAGPALPASPRVRTTCTTSSSATPRAAGAGRDSASRTGLPPTPPTGRSESARSGPPRAPGRHQPRPPPACGCPTTPGHRCCRG
ncbi:hypothetical protein SAMN04487818_110177 [Actinokineospora terrae]|uniref:Uncharacterized protein n=1 Tax=Actinokineospora terrae TaxID=155974 RepID=A0A1H9WGK1_9PSEU|nr:hypothetical protein SAMN04487818_110177 [Actinokineospora terrae]